MNVPQTKYAKSGDLNIAYQVVGDGPFDLVYVPGFVSNIELMWEEPRLAQVLTDLASFCRLILFDKRGTGLSDRVSVTDLPTIEMRMDDLRAVMDAVGSQRAALFGHSEGGCMCIVFASTYPERTRALITYGAFAKRLRSDDYPWAPAFDDRMAAVVETERQWGGPVDMSFYAPSAAGDAPFAEWFATYLRRSASPGAAAALMRMNSFVDVRQILSIVRVPTLVLQANGDRDVRVEEGRYLAAHIPGARYFELPSGDHLWYVSHEAEIVDEIQEFLTGTRHLPDADRFLATVLFTDIVSGTTKAAELGDRGWRALVERHHALVRTEIERHRGVEVDTAGDGFFATFDGPARAVRCGLSIRDQVRDLGIEIRAGVHTGECEMIAGKTGGIAVIIGSRVREQAAPGQVVSTSTVKDLVSGSGLHFEPLGARKLKGVPDEWQIYATSA
ncbi:MAG: adenylate/guanylate cyclase domain-containing protein [Chloroflexota bacterium]|nr:adenylate/guanylate cyclase domain-containing protein [Chloroflexota bacterium]